MIEIDDNKTVLHQTSDGDYERIPLKDYNVNPIIHKTINKNLLNKISEIYYSLGFELGINKQVSLEQFEIGFMREFDIEKAIEKWQIVSDIFKKYIDKYEFEFVEDISDVIEIGFLIVNDYDFSKEDKENLIIKRTFEIHKEMF